MTQSNIILSSAHEISTDAEGFYRDYWQSHGTDASIQPQVELRKSYIINTLLTQPTDSSRILELGVGGEGGIISALVSSADVYGIDVSDSAIERCRCLGIPVNKLNCDNTTLPFDKDFFDTVIALEVFEHFSNPQFVLEEIRRVLKPGGQLIISTPSPYTYHWPRLFYPDLFTSSGFQDFLLANRFLPKLHTDPFCQNCYQDSPFSSAAETSFSLYWQATKIPDDDLTSLHAAAKELFDRRDQHGRRIRPIEALELLKRCMQIDASSLLLRTDYLCALFYRFINGDTEEFSEQILSMLQQVYQGKNQALYAQVLLTIHHEAETFGKHFFDSETVQLVTSLARPL